MPSEPFAWRFHLVWVTAAAVVLDLGRMHAHHQADSLIPVLSSLYAWTPYYWEQNRFGMLVALLATPFDHPLTNLLVQNGITVWAALFSFPLGTAYLFRGGTPAAGPLAAGVYLLACPADTQFLFGSTVNVFATSLALGLGGLLVAGGRPTVPRLGAALGLFLVGSWVNSSLGVLMAPLAAGVAAVAAWEGRPGWARDGAVGVGLCGVGVAAALVMQKLAPHQTTWLVLPPAGEWPALIGGMAIELATDRGSLVWAAAGTTVAVAGVAVAPAGERRRAVRVVAVVLLVAVAYSALMGVLFKGRLRYTAPAQVLAQLAAVGAGVNALAAGQNWWRRPAAARLAGGLAVAAALGTAGPLGVASVRAALRAKWGADADALLAEPVTHLAGDYWRVWPVVFQANLQAADAGNGPQVWGVTHRSGPTAHRWRAAPADRLRVAVFLDDPKANDYLPLLGRPLRNDRRVGPFLLFVPADPP